MSTGNLSIVLALVPFRFRGLDEIGFAFYIFDIFIVVVFALAISYRFLKFRWTLKASFLHPTESLYVAAGLLSLATLVVGAREYGTKMGRHIGANGLDREPWFAEMLRWCFWVYSALALAFTVAIHMTM